MVWRLVVEAEGGEGSGPWLGPRVRLWMSVGK